MLTTDAVGGVWRYSLELACDFSARGATVCLAVMGPAPDAAQRAEAAALAGVQTDITGLPLDWLAASRPAVQSAAAALAAMAAQRQVHSVHLHTPALFGDAAWPCPVVAVAHSCVGTWWQAVRGGALPQDLAWRTDLVAQGLRRADAVIAPSHSFAASLRAQYGLTRRIDVVHNGRRAMPHTAQKRTQIFTAGRLWDAGKNIAVLDAAAAELDMPVLAAGPVSGPNGAQISCLHLHNLGNLDEAAMAHQFAESAVFASLALYEPFGLAVLEAAQAGCALVLSDIPTFRELWHGAALFADPHDPAALAAILRRLLASPEHCTTLGEAARSRAAHFTPEAMAGVTWAIHQAQRATPTRRSAA
jgi:glycosyltransferase involved in cell wall biosynthesis